mgnify:CR=1 FL=1
MDNRPIPLRMIHFITLWPLDDLVRFLTCWEPSTPPILWTKTYEWIEDKQPRKVDPRHLKEILAGFAEETDKRTKISRLPPHFFVWSDDLEFTYEHSSDLVIWDYTEEIHPFRLDWNPSIYTYEDLIAECPDFSLNQNVLAGKTATKNVLRKQTTQQLHARWQARAEELRKEHPRKSKSWIADRISREPAGESRNAETIRRKIRLT